MSMCGHPPDELVVGALAAIYQLGLLQIKKVVVTCSR
jgi:hypothetical protein